jgi:hypothetical protein
MEVMSTGPPADHSLNTATVDHVVRPCPYSEETVVGCGYYRPRSAHGDFPGAAQCVDAEIVSGASHVRHTICRHREA